MRRNFLLLIFLIILAIYIWYRTPVSSGIYSNFGEKAYKTGNYTRAVSLFEKSLQTNPKNSSARYYYVLSLLKLKPIYSVQKKIFDIANSKINDNAKQFAKTQIIPLKKELLKGVEDNYISNAASGKDIMRWDINSFPLKVYIENSNDVPDYYIENLKKALNQWTLRTNFIKFTITNNKNDANINIRYSDINKDDCPNGCRFTVAYTEPVIGKGNILKHVNLTFYKTNPRSENFTPREVYNAALHELGHTLGIMGHSPNPEDIMYANNDNAADYFSNYRSDFHFLKSRDIATIALLYRLKPNISNVKNLKSENFYYPSLILGTEEEVINKKIQELEKYIHDYPNFATGYINISSAYADSGNYEKAKEVLNKAEKLAQNTDEKFYIEYNRAVLYFNQQNFPQALEYANKANAIKSDASIQDLIEEINQNMKK